MDKQVYWILQCAVQAGNANDLRAMMNEMVNATKANEPGTLAYDWNLSQDGATLHVFERYKDSDAVLAHLDAFGKNYASRLLALVKPTGLSVYGSPDDRVTGALTPMGAAFFKPFGGFIR